MMPKAKNWIVQVSLSKKNEVVTQGTITADSYLVGGADKYIHGTTTGDVAKVKMMVNGHLIDAQRLVEADGSYKYYVGDQITSVNDSVTMIAYDAKGKELDRTNVSLTQTTGTLALNAYTLGDSYLTGKTTGRCEKSSTFSEWSSHIYCFCKS